MGKILVGTNLIAALQLGNADISAVWVGKELVWPQDLHDCDDKLLLERGFGILQVNADDTQEILQIDRQTYEIERNYDELTTEKELALQYEGPNSFPYIVSITAETALADKLADLYEKDRDYVTVSADNSDSILIHDPVEEYPNDIAIVKG